MKKLSTRKLTKINGGVKFIFGATNEIIFTTEEHDLLVKKDVLKTDTQIKHEDTHKFVDVCKEVGLEVEESHLCFMYRGYVAPEFAKITVLPPVVLQVAPRRRNHLPL